MILILVLGIPVVIFVWSIFFNAAKPGPLPVLPNPNGYDDLIKGAKMISPKVDFYSTSNLDELQAIVSTNAEGLKLARAGLQKQCGVPFDYTSDGITRATPIGDIKSLALGFAAEGDLIEIQGHPNEAVRSYLDIVHLANESSRGGPLIDALVEIAIEKTGTSKLRKLMPQLDAKTSHQTAAALQTFDAQRQTWGDIMQQEDYWAHRAYPGIRNEIMRILQYRQIEEVNHLAKQTFEDQQIKTRKLAIDLAARAYQLDQGHPPASIGDLVTNYLATIPQDPTTGTNMVYSPKQAAH
jgi:hypothetical protein